MDASFDDVAKNFDDYCAEAPDVLYEGCDSMYAQVHSLVADAMQGMPTMAICQCARLCDPNTLSSAKGGAASKGRL